MIKKVSFFLWIILCCAGCGENPLVKELDLAKQKILAQQVEVEGKNEEIGATKSLLEDAQLNISAFEEENRKLSAKIKEVELKFDSFVKELGRDGLILPVYLIGRNIVIYTKPYDDTQVHIGIITEIKQGDKIKLSLSQTQKLVEIPIKSLTGYRLLD